MADISVDLLFYVLQVHAYPENLPLDLPKTEM